MSLDVAITNAISGLNVSQEAISLLSQNIANANTENYARREIMQASQVINGVSQGAEIIGIQRTVDQFLIGEIRDRSSAIGQAEILNEYNNRISLLHGKPDTGSSLADQVDQFFDALRSLSNSPELTSLRANAVTQSSILSNRISDLARNFEELRLEADQEIKSNLTLVNEKLKLLYENNIELQANTENNAGRAFLEERRDIALQEISEIIDIGVFLQGSGKVSITIGNGQSILDDNLYELQYNPATSIDTFIDGNELNAISVVAIDPDGTPIGASVEVVSSGTGSTVTTDIRSGKIKALLDIRDTDIPNLLDQLDNLAVTLQNEFNKLHNDGSSFPGIDALVGTTAVTYQEFRDFSGSVRIAILDENGQPPNAGYGNDDNLRPLDLDLSSLQSGNGVGSPNMQTIIDEINEYFEPPKRKVNLGNLDDIRMVAVSNNVNTNGTFTFDFEVDNASGQDSNFVVTNVNVTDAGAAGLTSAIPASKIISPGSRGRTGDNFTVDFAGGAGGPYTIEVTVQVTYVDDDGDTQVGSETLDFVVQDGVGNIRNDRYIFTNTTPTNEGVFVEPRTSQRYARAYLVDENGVEMAPGSLLPGYLKIESGAESYKIAIDELTSVDKGLSTDSTVTATDRGFSHYFGLNNFFVENSAVKNSAINMQIRADILADTNLITLGELALSKQPSDPEAEPLYTYELGSASNQAIKKMADLETTAINYVAAGKLTASTYTFNAYSAEIITFISSQTVATEQSLKQQQIFQDEFIRRSESVSGVNLDEEIANTVLYQNAYQAAARIISVSNEMFDVLFNAV